MCVRILFVLPVAMDRCFPFFCQVSHVPMTTVSSVVFHKHTIIVFDKCKIIEKCRKIAVLMAEVYVVGQILSARNFREPNLFARWNIQAGMNCSKIKSCEIFIIIFQDHCGNLLRENQRDKHQQTSIKLITFRILHIQLIYIWQRAVFRAGQN